MISWRSAAVAQPAPNATSSAVLPLTCGTPHRSRVIVTPCPRPLDADGALARREPERLPLEVAPEVGIGDAVAEGGQPLVERDLVGRVLRERDAAGLTGGRTFQAWAAWSAGCSGGDGPRHRGGGDDAEGESEEDGATTDHARRPFVVRRVPVRGKGTCDAVHLSLHGRARSLRGRAPLVPAGRGARPPLRAAADARAARLGRLARELRGGVRRARVGSRGRMGRPRRFAPTTSSAAC